MSNLQFHDVLYDGTMINHFHSLANRCSQG